MTDTENAPKKLEKNNKNDSPKDKKEESVEEKNYTNDPDDWRPCDGPFPSD